MRSEAQVGSELPMPSIDAYQRKALEHYKRANSEAKPELSIEFQALAMAYMRHSAMRMPYDLDEQCLSTIGNLGMASGDEYRFKALELCERANEEQNLEVRRELESLANAYMRLAEMADRDTLLDPKEDVDESCSGNTTGNISGATTGNISGARSSCL